MISSRFPVVGFLLIMVFFSVTCLVTALCFHKLLHIQLLVIFLNCDICIYTDIHIYYIYCSAFLDVLLSFEDKDLGLLC